eukprot:TRINITY_DN34110_c0_g1_i1.p1 TRINITY_DN34110_c0_g1~~TRINITY_DN34110_c0_g1_i1.p1  ORF type:complete len:352 (-),score=44.72 TRINITY_DN34110_c0_g1_i1:8-958(-)
MAAIGQPPPLEIIIDRPGGVFAAGETVRGTVCVYSPKALSHNGLFLCAEGHLSTRKAYRGGVFDSLGTSKNVKLLQVEVQLAESGKIPDGKTPFAFDFVIPKGPNTFETYHGMHVEVRYSITAELRRGKLSGNLRETSSFLVVNPGQAYDAAAPCEPITFRLTPEKMKKKATGAEFEIVGQLDCPRMDVTKPLTGHIEILASDPIKSVEVQLIRVEEVVVDASKDKSAREATEIQNIQVADGNVCRGDPGKPFQVPLWLVFPRWFTCASVLTSAFRVEFEVNLVIYFADRFQITQNFPLRLYRAPSRGANPGRAGP